MKTIIVIIISLFVMFSSYATVKNVPADYLSIQDALNSCVSGDTVLVQPGVYYENIIWPDIASIKLLSAGDSTNTVIDGNNNGSVVSITFPIVDTTTMIKGFKITRGFLEWGHGSGIYIRDCSPHLDQLSITANRLFGGGGAGVYCWNSSMLITNSCINFNLIDSGEGGGCAGVSIQFSGHPRLTNVEISHNRIIAKNGGSAGSIGLGCGADSITINNCRICSNSAGDSLLSAGTAGLTFSYCNDVFINNTVVDSNFIGYSSNYTSVGILLSKCDFFSITNSSISSNFITDEEGESEGGGLHIYYSNGEMTNCRICSNSIGYGSGAGIFFSSSFTTLTNVLIQGNKFTSTDATHFFEGGGVYVFNHGDLYFDNCTIVDNGRVDQGPIKGPGLYIEATDAFVRNSIFWNENENDEFWIDASWTATVGCKYSDIRTSYPGDGNISQDPGFVSQADFHLLPSSVCLANASLAYAPDFDLDNNPRPLPAGSLPDIGCYEMDLATSAGSLLNSNLVSIYPNLITGNFTIDLAGVTGNISEIKVVLSDLSGNTVLARNFHNLNNILIDVSSIPAGLYLCKVMDDSGIVLASEKIVKY